MCSNLGGFCDRSKQVISPEELAECDVVFDTRNASIILGWLHDRGWRVVKADDLEWVRVAPPGDDFCGITGTRVPVDAGLVLSR